MARAFVRLMGGLGNQIFQAAFVHCLRESGGLRATLFDPGLDPAPGPRSRARQIDHLLPDEPVLSGIRATFIHRFSLSRSYQRILGRHGLLRMVREATLDDRSLIGGIENQIQGFPWLVYSGYYQTRLVTDSALLSIRARASQALRQRARAIDLSLKEHGLLSLRDIMIVHVRRGDYLTTSGFKVLGPSYYQHARLRLEQAGVDLAAKPVRVVSDEPVEALAMIRLVFPEARMLDLKDPLDVLAAVSQAPAKLIANSTLSLWGALLGPPGALVVYPSVWHDTYDFGAALCEHRGWIDVPNDGIE